MSEPKAYTCFFIAQMTTPADMQRLKDIAQKVLEPILKPLGYTIVTPDKVRSSSDIFKSVMKMLDVADLLVADLSDNNPNVYYELAIRHSLGLPYVLISQGQIRFDISGLRYVKYDPNDLKNKEFRAELKEQLLEAHNAVVTKGDIDNPITNFYGVPLVEVSPSSGVGLGYYRNFVTNTMKDIHNEANKVKVDDQVISYALQKDIHLEIWIPNRLHAAYHDAIQLLFIEPGKWVRAFIEKPNARPFPLYAHSQSSDKVTLVDIPTALNAVEVAINGRYSGVHLNKESDEWKKLEAQEIDRFRDTIQRHLNNEDDIRLKGRVHLVNWDMDGAK